MAIITHIQGGLGNQMFQYAAGLALSEHYHQPLLLDCSWFNSIPNGSTPRRFELPLLQIPKIEESLVHSTLPVGKIGRILQKFLPSQPQVFRESEGFKFDHKLFSLSKNSVRDIHLIGYWQSYKYFDQFRNQLQTAFTSKSPIFEHYQQYLKLIEATESTMLHIRRGDYVQLKAAEDYHKPLEAQYYINALNEMLHQKPDAHFFVFSDDIVWAKDTLPSNFPLTFIENIDSPESGVQELQLMTRCKNHIIANSSLSWWGAWLGKHPNGLVYTPNRWIRNTKLDLDDLLPKNWGRLYAS